MKKLLLSLILCVLLLAGCLSSQDENSYSEYVNAIANIEDEQAVEPEPEIADTLSEEVEACELNESFDFSETINSQSNQRYPERRELHTINLTNIGRTEFFYDLIVGDIVGSQTIAGIQRVQDNFYSEWSDQFVAVQFEGEVVIEVYFFTLLDSEDAAPFYSNGVILLETSPNLPDFDLHNEHSGPGRSITIISEEMERLAGEYIDLLSDDIRESMQIALFYSRVRVDNMRMASIRGSRSSRIAESVEVLEFRFERLVSWEEEFWLL